MPQYFKINSSDRLNATTTTPAQFTIACPFPVTGLCLKDIFIPATNFNVSATSNTIYFTDTAPRVAVVPPGYYTYSTLLPAIASAMTIASGGAGTYTCVLVALAQVIRITGSIVFSVTFSQTTNSMAEILGFINVDSVSSTVQTAISPLNLSTTLCYNIDVNNSLGTLTTTSAMASFVIPAIAGNVPSELYFQIPQQMPQSVTFPSSRTLNISVYDDKHRLLNFSANWYMTCVATFN